MPMFLILVFKISMNLHLQLRFLYPRIRTIISEDLKLTKMDILIRQIVNPKPMPFIYSTVSNSSC